MNKYEYIYMFAMGGKVEYSYETSGSVLERIDVADDYHKFDLFAHTSKPGDFMKLSTGEIISHVKGE